jgi:putative peptidoglycan lipid II flippase
VRTVIRNFFPVFIGRGVVQISAFIDTILASLLPSGAVAGLANAQVLYTLPVSLLECRFQRSCRRCRCRRRGLERSRVSSGRLDGGLRRIAFFVVPCAVAFLAFGHVIASALFQSGRFGRRTAFMSGDPAGSAVGLLAARLTALCLYLLRAA